MHITAIKEYSGVKTFDKNNNLRPVRNTGKDNLENPRLCAFLDHYIYGKTIRG